MAKRNTTPAAYAKGNDATKKAILVELRDNQKLAWRAVAKTLKLGSPGPKGAYYGQPARTAYTKYVRPHTESTPNGNVGRPAGIKSAAKKTASAATRKPQAKKVTSATKKPAARKATTPKKPAGRQVAARRGTAAPAKKAATPARKAVKAAAS
jgi:hypothetical protein